MTTLRVVLVDDHGVLRDGLRALIQAAPDMAVVGEAADGHAAVQVVSQTRPNLVVLDVSIPGLRGARLVERLREIDPEISILVVTVHEELSYVREMLAAGARGYVVKRSASSELMHALRRVAAGAIYLDSSFASDLVRGLVDRSTGRAGVSGTLSAREEEVVRLIALGHTNKEIATKLELSIKTVETHKVRSLEKLGLKSRADVVRYALHKGWLQTQ